MSDKKLPFIQFYTRDWLGDSAVSRCELATRGVWIDLLCAMHESGQSGELRGTLEQISRVARCSTAELALALTDLQTTGAADVTERNGVVTVVNRRMKREEKARKQGAERVSRFREKERCNAPVTDIIKSQSQIPETIPKVIEHQFSQSITQAREDLTKLTLQKPMCGRLSKEILTNKTGCFYDNCKVKPEEINARSLQTVLEEFAGKKTVTAALQCWNEAVLRTHQACVDGLVNSNIPGYCLNTFRDLMQPQR